MSKKKYDSIIVIFLILLGVWFVLAASTAPSAENQRPYNWSNISTSSVNFVYNASDPDSGAAGDNVTNCTLWLFKSGAWEENETNTTAPYTDTFNSSINITKVEDGSYLWKIQCYDNGSLSGNSSHFNVTVDTTAPVINIYDPPDGLNTANYYINFTYNISDAVTLIDTCYLYFNNGTYYVNITDKVMYHDINQTINISFAGDMSVLWKIGCNDSSNNWVNSSARNITIDTLAPTIQNQAPHNYTNSTTSSNDFVFNVSDNGTAISNCTLWINNGTWYRNSTDTSITKETNQTITISVGGNQSFLWKVSCYDDSANNINSSYRNISIDVVAPSGVITLPTNTNIYVTNPINIKCKGSDVYSLFTTSIKITKPSGKTVTKPVSVSTDWIAEFKGKDTNEAGRYIVDCIVRDRFGTIIEKTAQIDFMAFFFDHVFEDDEIEKKPVAKIDVSTKEQHTGLIAGKQGESKTFTIDGVTAHTIEFIEVTFTSATLEISSDPVRITLDVGQNRNVDIDGDGSDDINVILKEISDDAAKVEVINLEKKAEKEREERGEVITEEDKGRAGLWITILVILIVIAVGYYLLKGKKGKRGQVRFSKQDLGL